MVLILFFTIDIKIVNADEEMELQRIGLAQGQQSNVTIEDNVYLTIQADETTVKGIGLEFRHKDYSDVSFLVNVEDFNENPYFNIRKYATYSGLINGDYYITRVFLHKEEGTVENTLGSFSDVEIILTGLTDIKLNSISLPQTSGQFAETISDTNGNNYGSSDDMKYIPINIQATGNIKYISVLVEDDLGNKIGPIMTIGEYYQDYSDLTTYFHGPAEKGRKYTITSVFLVGENDEMVIYKSDFQNNDSDPDTFYLTHDLTYEVTDIDIDNNSIIVIGNNTIEQNLINSDNTTANTILPKTGSTNILPIVIILSISGIVSFYIYKKRTI